MVLSMLTSVSVFAAQEETTAVVGLKTNDLTDPVGIDSAVPAFSWKMQSSVLGQKQTAYQLTVSKDEQHTQVVWQSEKRNESGSVGVRYEGGALEPSTTYYWTVTVWDKDGKAVTSENATFETGLFGNSGWDQSEWIQVGSSVEEPEPERALNYAVDVDFQIVKSAVSVVLEATDKGNFLMWQFSTDGKTLHFRPHTKKGGGYAVLKDNDVTQFVKGTPADEQHLRIQVADNQVKTYLNGELIDTAPADSLNGIGFGDRMGKYGFRTSGGQEAGWLDNFVVTDYSADADGRIAASYDFEDGKNPFDAGTVIGGRLSTDYSAAGDITGLEPEAPPAESDVHYIVEADLTCAKDAVSILFNAADPSNFYMWQLNTADREGRVLLKPHTWKNGAYATYGSHTQDVTDAVGGVEAFQTNSARLKIDVSGTEIKTYLNGTLVDTFAIGTASDQGTTGIPVQAGYLGVRSSSAESGTVDNLKLTDYTDSESGEVLYNYTFDSPDDNPFLAGTVENGVFLVENVGVLLPPIGSPTFRKEFTPAGEVVSAKLYTTGLGIYEAYLNGERAGRLQQDGSVVYDELKPGYTSPDKRVLSYAYDVTQMIRRGEANTISAVVTSGWWNGAIVGNRAANNAFRAQLLLTYADGSKQVIGTDRTWKTSLQGPVISADIYQGEVYDGRADLSFRESGYNDADWTYAAVNKDFKGQITAQTGAAVRIRDDLELRTKTATVYDGVAGATDSQYGKINVVGTYGDGESFTLQAGEKAVFDLGQNFAGWEEIQLEGERGTRVTLRHAEILNDNDGLKSRGNDGPEGSIYTENLRSASAKGIYVMNGEGIETYHSSFTFYGFRYVEVSASEAVTIHGLRGIVLTSVEHNTGTLETSNADVNQLISNVFWGQYSNYLSVPTDCPQRDERQGWTADTQVFSTAGAYNADTKSFLLKWMQDMRDDQGSNGAYPDTAPGGGYMGQLGWADAGIIVPYNLYKMYGDKAVIEENYASMQKYIDVYLAATDKKGAGTAYGDWLSYEDNDKIKPLLAVAYYAWDAQMMAEMADVLGRADDAERYRQVYQTEKEYFIEQYVNPDGTLKRGEQTACLMALKMDLLPNEESKETVKQMLLDNIARNGDKLQTGFLGTSVIMQTLSDIGASDVAYKLLLQHGNPSWLYSVDQGATTIWERWNSYTKESGFGDNGMNSFNHYAYGAVAEWMYGYMAGVMYDFSQPGFQHILLQPTPDQILSYVNCSYDSSYGTIQSNWNYQGGSFFYEATVPANTTATISVPVEEGRELTVNGKSPEQVSQEKDGLVYTGTADGRANFEAVAGSYRFAADVTEYCYLSLGAAEGGASGLVSVNGEAAQPLPLTVKAAVGEELTVETYPLNDVDYKFAAWSGDAVSDQPKFTLVPQGDMSLTANYIWCGNDSLAQGCGVSSNAAWTVSDWSPAHLVDGILTSEPGSLGFTSTGSGSASVDFWIELDLGKDTEFDRIQLYPRTDSLTSEGTTASFPTDFEIKVRRDGEESYSTIGSYENYQAPVRKPAVLNWDEVQSARYIRLHVTSLSGLPNGEGTYYLQLAEMGVYNLSDEPPVPADTDKSILKTVLEYAKGAKLSDEYENVIDSVKNSFDAALDSAQKVYDFEFSTQSEIDGAWIALMNQIHRLGFQKGNPEQLALVISQASGLDLTLYVEAGQREFKQTLADAQATLKDGDAMQGEVDEAVDSLLDAMLALRFKADKAVLNQLLAQASAIDTSGYTEASVQNFNSAKAEAGKIAGDETISEQEQDRVDRACETLRAAIKGLAKAEASVQGDSSAKTNGKTPKTGETSAVPAAAVLLLAGAFVAAKRGKKR